MLTGRKALRVVGGLVALLALLGIVVVLGGPGPQTPGSAGSPAWAQGATPPTATVPPDAPTPEPALPGDAAEGGPAVVTIGFLINDIQDIDLERHRYQIDFYVWYRWLDPDLNPPATVEFLNDAERWATMRTPVSDDPVTLDDGSLYYRERVMSMFKTNMPLEDYPYDTPALEIIMEDVALGSDQLIFELDDPAVEESRSLSVPGYETRPPTAVVTDWEYPAMGEIGVGTSTVSRVVVTVPLIRPWIPYSAKIFIPLLVVVLCAAIVFLVHPKHVDARFGLGISSLLTLVALKWVTDSEMPLVDYIGLVDSLYLLAFIFIGVGLAETTYTTWRRGQGVDDTVLIDTGRRTFLIAGSVLVVSAALVLAAFLT